ncbi:MAG: flagellar motor switch protein FliN [Myxococcales bacterium]|nr:MAG: flagellar motor switch protein FliN [Myxococcales bacterium]
MNDPTARGPMGPSSDSLPDPRQVTPLSAPPADLNQARGSADSLSFVMDVPVEVTIELGRKTAKIGEVLRLGPGSILELSKANGEPLDVYVNNRLIARGEAVVVGERYGIRLTEVLVGDERGGRGSKE